MPIKQCNLYLSEIHFTIITMDFGEVVRVKSKFTVLHCPVDIYIALLWHALYSSLLYRMPCVHRTPMLLLPLLYV